MEAKNDISRITAVYRRGCVFSERAGMTEIVCSVILEKFTTLGISAGKIFVHRIDNGQVIDVTNVLELLELGPVYGTRLIVFSTEPGLDKEVDRVAKIIVDARDTDSPISMK